MYSSIARPLIVALDILMYFMFSRERDYLPQVRRLGSLIIHTRSTHMPKSHGVSICSSNGVF